jgi:D-alanyl-D-alanine carboxypeptidase-like protein
MNIRSYEGKEFVVESSMSVIRDDNLASLKYKDGDEIPSGKKVGDAKIIPQRTEVMVTDVKTDDARHVFVFARPANDPNSAFGWTSAANLVGSFANETAGFAPSDWKQEPDGTNKTCVDAKAIIRDGPPDFAPTANVIPQKSFVVVKDTSPDKLNVKVSKLDIVDGKQVVGEEIGWTRAANLRDGCADFYFSNEFTDQKGPNGCWDHGSYVGAKLLVNIVGFGGEMEQVTFDSLAPYLAMMQDAADNANLQISINSAFRTFQRQAELFALFKAGKGNKAAPAGASNHQHGQAFDLNTGHNVFNGTDKIYEWLKKHAPRHGFVRAVSNESWHWEYRPAVAAQLPPGKFMMPGIHDG